MVRSFRCFATLLVFAACLPVAPTNPFDSATPTELQAEAEISGAIVLPSADGAPLMLLDANGEPVPGVDNVPRTTIAKAQPGRTDAADFAFTGLKPGSYRVAPGDDARFKAFLAPVVPLVRVGPGESVSLGTLVFTRIDSGTGVVKGQVNLRDAQGGPRDIRVLRRVGAALEQRASLRTGPDGTFSVSNLPPGRYALSAELSGFTADYRVGFDLSTEPQALTNEADFSGDGALLLHPVSAVLVPDLPRPYGQYYTRDLTLPLQVLTFGGMSEMRLAASPAFVDASGADVAWRLFGLVESVVLPDVQGRVTVYAQFRNDPAAEFPFSSDVFETSVVRDSLPPRAISISARGLAADASGVLWVRDGSRAITFDVEGTDAESAVAAVAVHHDAAGSPGNVDTLAFDPVDAPPGLVRLSKTFVLSAVEGPKSVWVYFRDRAGNTSDPLELALRVDGAAPLVSPLEVVGALAGNVLDATRATLRVTVPAVCAGVGSGNIDDCPVAVRLGAKPLPANAATIAIDPGAFRSNGGGAASLEFNLPFAAQHGEVVSFEADFTDRAGNVARVASANYTMRLAGRVTGRALIDGVPDDALGHAGTAVRLTPMGAAPSSADRTTLTTADGAFAFDDVPQGRYIASLTRDGAVPQQLSLEVVAGQPSDLGLIRLVTARGFMTGRFLRADVRDDGTAHGGIRVSVLLGDLTIARVVTDPDGSFALATPGIPVTSSAAPYRVVAEAAGYVGQNVNGVHVSQGATTVLNPSSSDPSRPVAVELSRIGGNLSLCEQTGPCTPVALTRATALRAKLENGAAVTRVRVKVRTPFTGADATPWTPYADGDLVPVDISGPDGVVEIYLQAEAGASSATLSSRVVLDTVPPAIDAFVLEPGPKAAPGFTRLATGTARVAVTSPTSTESPLDGIRVVFAGTAPSSIPPAATRCDVGSPCSVPFETGAREGLQRAWAFACDLAGNCTSAPASASIVYDTTPPRRGHGVSFSPSSPAIQIVEDKAWTRSLSYDLALSLGTARTDAGDSVRGLDGAVVADVAAYRYGAAQADGSIRYGAWTALETSVAGASVTLPAPSLPPVDATHRTYLQLRDLAGNETDAEGAPLSYDLTLDTTPPDVSLLLDEGAAYSRSGVVRLGVAASAADAGPARTVWLSRDAGLFSAAERRALPLTDATWDLRPEPAPAGDGLKSVHARFVDAAGNVADRSASIFVDRTPPEFVTASCGSCVIDATGKAWTQQPELTLYVSAADASGRVGRLSLGIDAQPASEIAYATAVSSIVPATDGDHAIHLVAIDPAGNASAARTLSVTLDRAVPEFALRIGDGAATVASANVTLALTATDSSDFAAMEVSNTASFTSAARVAFAGALAWRLAAPDVDGTKEVFVRVTDHAGNATVKSASVVLKAAASVAGTVTADGAAASGVAVTISGTSAAGAAFTASATTDPAGAYAFSPVPAGTYALAFSRQGYETGSIPALSVAAGTDVRAPFALRRASGSVTGRVLVSSGTSGLTVSAADVQGVAVVISSPSLATTYVGLTDASGSYAIDGVPAPLTASVTYTVTATKRGFAAATGAVSVTAGAAATVPDLSLVVAGSSVVGCVTVPAPAADSAGVAASLAGVAFNGTSLTRTASALSATSASCSGAGRYDFSAVPDGSYTVTLARAGYVAASAVVTVSGSNVTAPATTLARSTGAVVGNVTGAAGGTGLMPNVGQALVSLSGADLLGGTYQATTTSTGDWRIDNVPVSPTGAAYTVTVAKPQYASSGTVSVVVLAQAVATAPGVTLSIGSGTVAGTVTLSTPPSADSSGVVATLNGSAFDGTPVTRTADAPSNAAGNYSFTRVPPGAYTLQLAASGYQVGSVAGIAVRPDATVAVATQALLRATGALYGRLLANANGSGLAVGAADLSGASVVVSGTGLVGTYATNADANGNWSIAGIPVAVPSATYTVSVSKAGFVGATMTATVSANGSSAVSDVTLGVATYALAGTAALEGNASAAGVTATLTGIAFNGASYTASAGPTLASGAFSFSAVPAGSYTVTLTGNPSYVSRVLSAVTVAPPPSVLPTLSGTLMRATGAISGRVVPSAGASGLTLTATEASNVSVVLSDGSLASRYGAVTDSSGNFTITGVPCPTTPGAAYALAASKAGYVTSTSAAIVSASQSTPIADVALVARANRVLGSVRVSTPATSAAGVSVTLSGTAFNGTSFAASATKQVSGTSATFDFAALPDSGGAYVITASMAGFAPASRPVFVAADVAGVSLTLVTRAVAQIAGTVTVSAGSTGLSIGASERLGAVVTVSGADLPAAITTQTDGTGAFLLTDVPVNVTAPYSVSVSKDNFIASAPESVSLSDGATTTASGLGLTVAAGSVPTKIELHERTADGDPVTYGAATVTLTGTAFNGAAVGPLTVTSSAATGDASFASLPAGVYVVQASLAQHGTDTISSIAVTPGAVASLVTLRLYDIAPPSSPLVAASRGSPTRNTSTTLAMLAASADPTLPAANFRDYRVRICSPTCATRPVEGGSPGGGSIASGGSALVGGPVGGATGVVYSWDGNEATPFPLVSGVDNYLTIWARDWNGNASPSVTLPVIKVETRSPTAPTGVRVDNRSGTVRVSWNPVSAAGSLPVAGYKVYYGSYFGSSAGDFRGDFASQGVSPVDVGNETSLTLTGLPDSSSFYVAVSAYDSAVDPSPNESAISGAVIANPNRFPLDRAARARVIDFASSVAKQRDTVFVAGGNAPPYTIQPYRYSNYNTLEKLGSGITDARAKVVVADENRTLYAFDPAGEGVAIYDVSNAAGPALVYSRDLPNKQVYQFVPAHRAGKDGAVHHFFTYKEMDPSSASFGRYRLATVSTYSNHLDVNTYPDGYPAAGTTVDLKYQTQPLDMAVVGRWAFVRQSNGMGSCIVSAYTVNDAFSSTVRGTAETSFPYIADASSMVMDWPNLYISAGNQIYVAPVTVGSEPTFPATPMTAARTAYPIQKLAIAGGYLFALEAPSTGTSLVEVFDLSTPIFPVRVGNYELNNSYEKVPGLSTGNAWRGMDLVFNGNDAFVLTRSVSYTNPEAVVDVVELGNPRALVKTAALYPDGLAGVNVAARGSRLYMTAAKQSNAELVDADMRKAFVDFDTASTGLAYTKVILSADPTKATYAGPRTLPLALSGDYAFVVDRAPNDVVRVYDVSIPLSMTGAVPVATFTPTLPAGASSLTITGLAAGNDFLLASVTYFDALGAELQTPMPYVQRWDLTTMVSSPSSPVLLAGSTKGSARTLDLNGRYAYVGARDAICRIDATSAAGGSFAEQTCFAPPKVGAATTWFNSVYSSGGVLTASRRQGLGVTDDGVFRYDLGNESGAPQLLNQVGFYTSPALLGAPQDVKSFGPTLLVSQTDTTYFEGFMSFENLSTFTDGALVSRTPVMTSAPFLAKPNQGNMAVVGPYLIVPSFLAGTTVYRMY